VIFRGVARVERTPSGQGHLATVANRIMPQLDPDVMWRMAIHEAGHIVVSHVLRPSSDHKHRRFVDVPATLLESRETAHNRIAALPCVKPTNARIKMLSDHAGGTSEGSK